MIRVIALPLLLLVWHASLVTARAAEDAVGGADAVIAEDERTPGDLVLQELYGAVEAHPDDPDLRFALAAHLEARGDRAEAAIEFTRYAELAAAPRPDVWLRLGRLHAELGQDERAAAALQRAVETGLALGAAHLHLGLSLRRLGRNEEAANHFARAGEAEPELLPEASLLQALARIDLGDERGAVPLLERAVELDPSGETARSVRLLLPRLVVRNERLPLVYFEWFGGYETDSNVTLDGDTELPNVSAERSDARAIWGTTLALRPIQTARAGLSLGVRYDQAEQEELSEYDTRRELAFASLRLTPHERITLRLDGLVTRTRLDHRRHERTRSLWPSLLFAIGDELGVARLFASLEEFSYPEEPILPNLDRDGWALGGGIEHFVPVRPLPDAWFSLGADFRRFETDSDRDPLLGFASPYDHDRWRATATFRSALWLGFEGEATLSWSQERYAHRNLFDALTDDGVGTVTPSTRLDRVLDGHLSLVRPITRYAGVELRLQQISRSSNVDIFEYDRRIIGVYVKLHTP